MKFDESSITKAVQDAAGTIKPRVQGELSETDCESVIKKVQADKNLDAPEKAMVLITGLVQNGGSNKNASTLVSYQAFGKTLNAQEFSGTINTVKKGATARQFCRTMATEIAHFASALGEPGDLAKQMRREDPNLSEEHAIWCSNFQTTNPNCPQNVRKWLVDNFQARFDK